MNLKEQIKRAAGEAKPLAGEQRVIVVMLLTLIVLGLSLPTVKAKIAPSPSASPNTCSAPSQDAAEGTTENGVTRSIENTDTATEDRAEDVVAKEASAKKNPEDINKDAASSKDKKATHSDDKSRKEAGKTTGGNNSATPSGNDGKTWVPPKYKTVHHEAEYKTVKVVICNYCGDTFGSTGEFQVHKDLHGG